MNPELDHIFTNKLFDHIQECLIIMDSSREIIKVNPAAEDLLGWHLGGKVPYCSYCQKRTLDKNQERCYLIENKGNIPYFSSEIPTIGDYHVNVEMSNALFYEDAEEKEKYYLLVLRDRTFREKEEEARTSKKMLRLLTEATETEQKRLSQELHDGVGQSLYSIAIAMDNISTKVEDERLQEYTQQVRKKLGKVMEDVKVYSQMLRPLSLDALGLILTIESLIESIKTKIPHTAIHFHYNFDGRLPPMIEINAYRVIQESLHNIMKHAHANNVHVRLSKQNKTLHIKITDDGIGFIMEKKEKGLGLLHIQERISQLAGTTNITSEPGIGTMIKIEIPLEEDR